MRNLNFLRKSERKSVGTTLASTVGSPSVDRRGNLLKPLFLAMLFLIAGIGNVWAETYSVTFKTAASDGSTCNTTVSNYVTETTYITSMTADKAYYNGKSGMKLGSSSAVGNAVFTLTDAGKVKASNISVVSVAYDANKTYKCTITYTDNTTVQQSQTFGSNLSCDLDNTKTISKIKFESMTASKGRGYISSFTITYSAGGGDTPTPSLEQVTVSGTPSKTSYEAGDAFDITGLTVTGSYDIGDDAAITEGITWEARTSAVADDAAALNAYTLTAGQTALQVRATVSEIASSWFDVTGITVNEHVVTPGTYNVTLNNALFGSEATSSLSGDALHDYTGQQNDITFNYVKGSGSNMYMNASQIRLYKNITLVVSVPAGFNITEVTGLVANIAANVGSISNNTWTGKSNSITFSFTESSGNAQLGAISVTYEAIAPEVTVDPSSLSFDAKQNIAVEGKTFTLEGANLTSGLTLAASAGFNVSPESITAADAMAQGGVAVTVTPATPTATTTPVEGTVTISGGGLTSDVVVNLSMAVTPTYLVAIAVNDGDMGSATINGGTASIYVTDDEEIALVAAPVEHHEFVNWTVSDENIVLDNENAATTTALAGAAGTITANFQVQACSELAAPVLNEIAKTYQSATIAWNAVANASSYAVSVVNHSTSASVFSGNVNALSKALTGLAANTRYDYTIMAVGDGTDYCDANNPVLENYFTTDDYPAATLSLVENGGTPYNWGTGLKLNSVIALPDELAGLGCTGKVLVGWDADENCATAPAYAKGANYTIASTADVLYAVFATENTGDPLTLTLTNSTIQSNASGKGSYGTYTLDTYWTGKWMINNNQGTYSLQLGYNTDPTKSANNSHLTVAGLPAGAKSVHIETQNGTASGRTFYLCNADNLGTASAGTYGSGSISAQNGYVDITITGAPTTFHIYPNGTAYIKTISVNYGGDVSYSGYTTECEAQLPVLAAPTFPVAEGVFYESTDITISAAMGASIYYTTDGTTPSSTNGTLYEGAITLNAYGTYNFKAIAVQAGHEDSEVAEATYYFGMTFASVGDLYTYLEANSLTSLNNVKVTGLVSRIKSIDPSKYVNGQYYISDNGQEENELYIHNGKYINGADFTAEPPCPLNPGDQVTIIGNYVLNGETHQLAAGNRIVANGRVAAELESIAISVTGTVKTAYSAEDNLFSFDGLTATANYSTGYTKDVTEDATWKAKGESDADYAEEYTVAASGDISVIATYEQVTNDPAYVVTVNLTTKTLKDIALSYNDIYTFLGMAMPTPTVTASYEEDIEDEDVTALVAAANGFDTESAYNSSVAGTYPIEVSYTLGEVTKTKTYNVEVRAYNNLSKPYTVAEALDIISKYFNTSTPSSDSIVVAGIVSRLDENHVNTYWISYDGTENDELEVYSGKYLNKATFTEANQLHVGDEVVVTGKVKTYQSTKEFDSNSRLISVLREPEFAIADIVAADEFEANVSEDMTVVPTVNSGDAEFTLTSGNEAVVTIVNGKLHAVAEGDAEITASRAATNNANALNYKAKEITFNVHVIAERTRYTVTFDANGGEGTDPEAIANQLAGAPVDMPAACLYNKEGHGFTGWKVINLSTEAEIEVENDQFEMPAANVKIQAQWAVVATCAISFQIGGNKVATANAPQTAEYSLAGVSHPTVPGFTWEGWSETEYAEEVENAPTTISSYTPEAGENTKTLYGIYSRVDDSDPNYGKYVKATAVAEGDYLIVCESEGKVFDGSLETLDAASNNKAASISDGVLTLENADNYVFTIAEVTEGYSIQAASGKYIGQGSDANGMNAGDAALVNTVSITDGNADIRGAGGAYLRYNATSGQERFRYFKSSTYTSQKAIQLYKKNVGSTVYTSSPVEKVTITFDLDGGQGGCQTTKINKGSEFTICADVPTLLHNEFAGWKNGDDEYVAGQAYTFDADITLTAQWDPAATYTITYNVNGSEDDAPTQEAQYAGDQFAVAAAVAKDGYTFKGWLYNNKLYKAGAQFTMPAGAVEFVANWKKNDISTEKMTLITDANALIDGMQIGLGCSYDNNFAMAGDIPSGETYFASVSEGVSIDGNVATFTAAVQALIIEEVESGWKIRKDATNYLKETAQKKLAWGTSSEATTWTISFSEGNVVIKNTANNIILFNKQSPRFTTYGGTSTQVVNIQLFGKAIEVTGNANISDLGYEEEPQAIVASGNITLTIDKPTTATSLIAKNGATIEVEKRTEASDVVVELGSAINATDSVIAPEVLFKTQLGDVTNPDYVGHSGEYIGANLIRPTGDVIIEIELTQEPAASYGWYAFSVPFQVDAMNGVYFGNTKLVNEVGYAIMSYHEDIRANGEYAWKKYRGILQPGELYIITVGNIHYKTLRFKKVEGAPIYNSSAVAVQYSEAGDAGWNGLGNPNLFISKLANGTGANAQTAPEIVQFLDHVNNVFASETSSSVNVAVGGAFFVQAEGAGDMKMAAGDENPSAILAPARRVAENTMALQKVRLYREGASVRDDQIFLRATEDATTDYQIGHDVAKMSMGTAKCAQIYVDAYNKQLCAAEFPMDANNSAIFPIVMTAPRAGEYRLSVQPDENVTLYLMQNDNVIWNLSMSDYTLNLISGNNNGYSIKMQVEAAHMPTGVENGELLNGENGGAFKFIENDMLFIIRDGKRYNATGKRIQ